MKGVTFLTKDAAHEYYKVPIDHGEKLVRGTVSSACLREELVPVCHGVDGYDADFCVKTSGDGDTMKYLTSQLLCKEYSTPIACDPLHGIFVAMGSKYSYGDCGVLEDRYCAMGQDYTSGEGSVYSQRVLSAQYWALCAKD